MTEYKLIYFDARGLSELVRWILKQGGIPFTDERVKQVDWPEKKKTIEGGKLPVLMLQGHTLSQSLAIARFAAKKANLVPDDDLRAAFIDSLVDTLHEVKVEFFKIFMTEKTEEEKKKEHTEEFLPNRVVPLMELLSKKMTGKEWVIDGKVTWGDLAICVLFNELKMHQLDLLPKYPVLEAHYNRVTSLPNIKEWLNTRPKSQF